MSALHVVSALFHRELLRTFRNRAQLIQPVLFFALVAVLFPFALGPSAGTEAHLGVTLIWIAVLLATTLSLDEIFRSDFDHGGLELMLLSPHPLALLVAVKALAHWVFALAPLIAIAVVVSVAFHAAPAERLTLFTTLLLGTLIFSFVGTVASALTVGLRGGALLLALLIIPLYIPVLIFGASAVSNAALGLPTASEHYLLAGLAVLAATLAPFAGAAGLRARLS